jgi:hypothetical protein
MVELNGIEPSVAAFGAERTASNYSVAGGTCVPPEPPGSEVAGSILHCY